jgi:Transposase IS116/IS110/IS902 family
VGRCRACCPGPQRDVASALPGCDYHDTANFELERRRIFHQKWFCVGRAGRPVSAVIWPGNHESAGKRRPGKRRPGNTHLQTLLVECAWSAVRHDGYLKSLFCRHVMRNGGYRSSTAKKKAIIWHIMVTGKPYHELGAGYFASLQDPERKTCRLIARLQALGHTVTINPAA